MTKKDNASPVNAELVERYARLWPDLPQDELRKRVEQLGLTKAQLRQIKREGSLQAQQNQRIMELYQSGSGPLYEKLGDAKREQLRRARISPPYRRGAARPPAQTASP